MLIRVLISFFIVSTCYFCYNGDNGDEIMVVGMAIIFTDFILTLTVAIIYFYKKKIKNFETSIYNVLVVLSLCSLIIEFWLCCNILAKVELYSLYNLVLNRSFLLIIFFWFAIFLLYMINISFDSDKALKEKLIKKYGNIYQKKIVKKMKPLLFVVIALILFLPINLISDGTYAYSDGPAVYVLYVVLVMSIIVCTICVFKNRKTENFKKYIPFAAVIICFSIVLFGRQIIPGLLLNSFALAFPTFLMYHTIENPDVKIIEELSVAKNQAEKYSNDKAIFLFNMSQQIKAPLNNIELLGEQIIEEKDFNIIKEKINNIRLSSQKLQYIVNDSLDISTLEAKNLKIVESKYDLKNIIEMVSIKLKEEIENKPIKFNLVLSEDIPNKLYGDTIKIKQIINTLLFNAAKHTKEGFIELDVNSIIKRDVCRLIIKVEDSGCGMNATIINKLFEKHDKEECSTDKNTLTIDTLKKMINMIGGTIMVQSEVNKGTEFTVVLDQKVVEEDNSSILQTVKNYEKSKTEKLKVLIIDDDETTQKSMSKMFDINIIDIELAHGGQEALENLRNGELYNLIFIADNLSKLDSITTFKKMNQINSFNIPVIIMTETSNNKIFTKYKAIGFNEVLLRPVKLKELDEILEKYIK